VSRTLKDIVEEIRKNIVRDVDRWDTAGGKIERQSELLIELAEVIADVMQQRIDNEELRSNPPRTA